MPDDLTPATRPSGAVTTIKEPADWLKSVYDWAALNAQPPLYLTPVVRPSRGPNPPGPGDPKGQATSEWLVQVLLYLLGSALAAVYWLAVLGLWTVTQAAQYLIGHPKRLAIGCAVGAVGYLYLTHR